MSVHTEVCSDQKLIGLEGRKARKKKGGEDKPGIDG